MKFGTTCGACVMQDTCSFFWNYQDHPLVQSRRLIEKFCMSETGCEECERISYYRNHRDVPPANLAPDGLRMPSGRHDAAAMPLNTGPPLAGHSLSSSE